MKTSRILLSLLALATIVGCSEGNDENQVVNPNEGDVSYLAVKLKAAGDLSRASDSDFADGIGDENLYLLRTGSGYRTGREEFVFMHRQGTSLCAFFT